MTLNLSLGYILYTVVVFLIVLFIFLFLKYYRAKNYSLLANSIYVFSISCTLFSVMLLPVDIYLVSSNIDQYGRQIDIASTEYNSSIIRILYYVFYSLLLLSWGVLLPFSFFWYEEWDEEEISSNKRFWSAFRYTMVVVIILTIFFLLGNYLKINTQSSEQWISQIYNQLKRGHEIMGFAIGGLSIFGVFGMIIYTSSGLSWFPLGFFFTEPDIRSMSVQDDFEYKIKENEINIDYLTKKYAADNLSEQRWETGDRSKMKIYRQKQKKYLNYQQIAKEARDPTCCQKFNRCCENFFLPFRWIFGFFCGSITLLIVISIFLTQLDKQLHSQCGYSCGYALDHSNYIHPLNETLRLSSKWFPLDFIIFGLLCFFFFICTLSGFTLLSIRLICVTYRVKKNKTQDNTLALLCWLFILIMLALNVQMVNLLPTYSAFGSQFYSLSKNGTVIDPHPCTLSMAGHNDHCILSQAFMFSTNIFLQIPFFGVVLHYSNWLFIGLIILFLIGLIFRQKKAEKGFIELDDEDIDLDDDF